VTTFSPRMAFIRGEPPLAKYLTQHHSQNSNKHHVPFSYLVRHAELEHNVSKDFSERHPPLTSLGLSQASALADTFPHLGSIAIIFTSPLTLTLRTTLAGSSHILSKKYLKNNGDKEGTRLIIGQELQEQSDLPYTGTIHSYGNIRDQDDGVLREQKCFRKIQK
jgi:hypothetical protein